MKALHPLSVLFPVLHLDLFVTLDFTLKGCFNVQNEGKCIKWAEVIWQAECSGLGMM